MASLLKTLLWMLFFPNLKCDGKTLKYRKLRNEKRVCGPVDNMLPGKTTKTTAQSTYCKLLVMFTFLCGTCKILFGICTFSSLGEMVLHNSLKLKDKTRQKTKSCMHFTLFCIELQNKARDCFSQRYGISKNRK